MIKVRQLIFVAFSLLEVACSSADLSTECRDLSRPKAIALAIEQKQGLLERSVQSERVNFADSMPEVAHDRVTYAAKVRFKGRDGSYLVALIDEDCYVGWTIGHSSQQDF